MNNLELARPLVVIDLETTGLIRQDARIVEICMIKIFPDGKEDKFEYLVNPEKPIPQEAIEIHGIKDEDVQEQPTFKDLSGGIVNFMDDCDLCGFNLNRYDIDVLQSELKRAGITWAIGNRYIIDVKSIYHKYEPRDLTTAYSTYCGKTLQNAHRAENDARATIEILEAQLQKHSDLPKNVPLLNEFMNPKDPSWVDRGGNLRWDNGEIIIAFGKKHPNKLLKEVVKEDPCFLTWILSKDFPFDVKQIVRGALEGKFPQPPDLKLKTCDNCGKDYLKGNGITKIWLMDEERYDDYPDWRYIQFEGIEEFSGRSYAILCFCGDKCLTGFMSKN